MSNGRSEKRIERTVSVEVCLQDERKLREMALTENVSAHCARVLVERKRLQARIIYCQRVSEGRFAVGLELSRRVELWAKPY